MAGIPLAEAIADLREELARAIKEGKGQTVRFKIGRVEMEFELAVTKEGGGSGKAKFLVLEVGAEGTLSHAHTHRLKLTLDPMSWDQDSREFVDLTADADDLEDKLTRA